MANEDHLARLQQGVKAWNQWRDANRNRYFKPDLAGAHLFEADLRGARLAGADLYGADLRGADLFEANLSGARFAGANLSGARFAGADLVEADLAVADLRGADLRDANLEEANLRGADLTRADLHGANLERARLVQTKFEGANLTGCKIYGVSAWNIHLTGARQADLVITPADEPVITVDNLEVAQFIYMLLYNEKIRHVIDTITSKVVLILGCFTPERKAVLDAIREELRHRNYLPIVFDFEAPGSRDFTETVSTLAHIARFIIADVTDAKSIPQELERIVPSLPSVPVQPLLHISSSEYGMFEHFTRYPWVLETYRYERLEEVIASLPEKVITPAEFKAKELSRSMGR
jgi:Pentapeptide repeats (8 copies)